MDKYIIYLLMKYQDGLCARCGMGLDMFQINHKRYGEDVTVNDLELVHGDCHGAHHDVEGVMGLERSTRMWKDGHLRGHID